MSTRQAAMWMLVKPNHTNCISGTSLPLMGNLSQQKSDACSEQQAHRMACVRGQLQGRRKQRQPLLFTQLLISSSTLFVLLIVVLTPADWSNHESIIHLAASRTASSPRSRLSLSFQRCSYM